MSDAQLRELERKWKRSGVFEDEQAWLLNNKTKVKVPETEYDQSWESCAFCGHPEERK